MRIKKLKSRTGYDFITISRREVIRITCSVSIVRKPKLPINPYVILATKLYNNHAMMDFDEFENIALDEFESLPDEIKKNLNMGITVVRGH